MGHSSGLSYIAVALLLAYAAEPMQATELVLKDGQQLQGQIVLDDGEDLEVRLPDGEVRVLSRLEIARIDRRFIHLDLALEEAASRTSFVDLVSDDVSREAATRLEGATGDEADRLYRIALGGAGAVPAVAVLMRRTEGTPLEVQRKTLEWLSRASSEVRREAAARLEGGSWSSFLARFADLAFEPGDRTLGLRMLAADGAPRDVVGVVVIWAGQPRLLRPARQLLQEAGRHNPFPEGLVNELLAQPLPATLEAELADLLGQMGSRHPLVRESLLQRASVSDHPALLLALPKLPRSTRKQVQDLLRNRVLTQDFEGESLAAALQAASHVGVPELGPYVVDLAGDEFQDNATRVIALRAIPRLAPRNARTIEMLIELLEHPDPKIQVAAHEALVIKSGKKFPGRPELWRRWREQTDLPY